MRRLLPSPTGQSPAAESAAWAGPPQQGEEGAPCSGTSAEVGTGKLAETTAALPASPSPLLSTPRSGRAQLFLTGMLLTVHHSLATRGAGGETWHSRENDLRSG